MPNTVLPNTAEAVETSQSTATAPKPFLITPTPVTPAPKSDVLMGRAAQGGKVNWTTTLFMGAFHVAAIAALFCFSWKNLAAFVVLWLSIYPDSYEANLYLLQMSRIALPYSFRLSRVTIRVPGFEFSAATRSRRISSSEANASNAVDASTSALKSASTWCR